MSAKAVPVRITDQYRDRDVMVYELICEGTRISVRFIAVQGDSPGWRAEITTTEKENPLVVTGQGATRADALTEAGTAWASALRGRPYPAFEWSGIAEALTLVRAL